MPLDLFIVLTWPFLYFLESEFFYLIYFLLTLTIYFFSDITIQTNIIYN
jgi:hypothetical protein